MYIEKTEQGKKSITTLGTDDGLKAMAQLIDNGLHATLITRGRITLVEGYTVRINERATVTLWDDSWLDNSFVELARNALVFAHGLNTYQLQIFEREQDAREKVNLLFEPRPSAEMVSSWTRIRPGTAALLYVRGLREPKIFARIERTPFRELPALLDLLLAENAPVEAARTLDLI